MKEHARQRRRDKRELAALHQALAEQEGNQSSGNRCGRGSGGGAEHAGVGGAVGVGFGGAEATADTPARASDGGSNNPCSGGGRTARRASPPPVADRCRSIETNANQGSTELGDQVSDGGQASPASRSAPQDPAAVPQGEASSRLWDESSTYDGGASPTESETTLSRRALLVRLGFVRARLEAGGTEGEGGGGGLRPVAESLRREVEELSKSGAAAGAGAEGEGFFAR